MPTETARAAAALLMREFVERTGVTGSAPPRRYLWTDAFAVCNLLGLSTGPGDEFAQAAAGLVEQVHRVLGRHRGDDGRSGWISGFDELEGARHPTAGGLRIGKPQPERRADEPYDARREWDRDGQYFHYLTRWMHALDRFARSTGHAGAQRWAVELAAAAVRAFVVGEGRMAWKMSIDLTRPLVPSMGQHDPLDGLVTCLQLRAHADTPDAIATLDAAIETLAALAAGRDYRTDDPLGLGGLLVDAWKLRQLPDRRHGDALAGRLLALAADGLEAWLRVRPLSAPATQRLAFRELGMAIGLHAAQRISTSIADPADVGQHALRAASTKLQRHWPLAETIESFWMEPRNQAAQSWAGHLDINAVMLTTSLSPAGHIDLR